MKPFSVYFQKSQRKEWEDHYFDYAALKDIIAKFGYRRSKLLSLSREGGGDVIHNIHDIERVLDDYDSSFYSHNAAGGIINQDSFAPPEYTLMNPTTNKNTTEARVGISKSGSGLLESDSDGCFTTASSTASENIHDQVARYEREEFCLALDREISKVSKLYLSQIDFLQEQLVLLENDTNEVHDDYEIQQAHTWNPHSTNTTSSNNIKEEQTTMDNTTSHNPTTTHHIPMSSSGITPTTTSTTTSINILESRYTDLGDEILELFVFIGANITALRQMLIRYDSMIRSLDGPPLSKYYTLTRSTNGSMFEVLHHHRQLEEIVDKFDALSDVIKKKMGVVESSSSSSSSASHSLLDRYKNDMALEISKIEAKLLIARQAVENSVNRNKTVVDRVIQSTRYYYTLGSLMNEIVLTDAFLKSRGVTLKREIIFFSKCRKKRRMRKMSLTSDKKKSSTETSTSSIAALMNPSLVLVFVATFLYLMNHYIIEPSSAAYMSSLGGNDALAGILIGMTPWSSIMAAFAYSVWSNTSYRHPMICSAIFLTSGSLIYGLADKYNSITLAFMGRFATGLGGPCAMLMRYIADTVPKKDRTAIAVLLSTVSAAGMSSGPGFAVLLDFMDFQLYLPIIGQININGLTGPGYFMFLLWLIYLVLVLIMFEDGERKGLSELARSESMKPTTGDDHHYIPPISPNNSVSVSFEDDVEIMPTKTEEEFEPINHEEVETKNKPIKLINQATMICMVMKFMGKLCLEVLTCSDSIITRNRYGWSIKNVGTLGFVNGCLTVPISIVIGYLTQSYTDWTLLMVLQGVALLGVVLMIDVTDTKIELQNEDYYEDYYYTGYNSESFLSVGPWRYVIGQIVQFCGYHASQSIVMSMLSKVVPLALAKGTFNSGFIASMLTSTSRATGDFLITAMGFISIRYLLNLLAIPCFVITVISILASFRYRHKLSV